jgi:hypothetical protein
LHLKNSAIQCYEKMLLIPPGLKNMKALVKIRHGCIVNMLYLSLVIFVERDHGCLHLIRSNSNTFYDYLPYKLTCFIKDSVVVGCIYKILALEEYSRATDIANHTAIIMKKFQISTIKDLHLNMPVLMNAHNICIVTPKVSINSVNL